MRPSTPSLALSVRTARGTARTRDPAMVPPRRQVKGKALLGRLQKLPRHRLVVELSGRRRHGPRLSR